MSDDSAPATNPLSSIMSLISPNSAQDREDAKAEAHKKELAALRDSVFNNARNSTSRYFSQLGLNPDDYSSDIDQRLQDILSGISSSDENPGSYFRTAPQSVYGDLTTARQQKLQSDLDRMFAPNFETSKIGMTIDDPYLQDIEHEQRGAADAIIRNMVKRGVLTNTGASAAFNDLENQTAGVRGKLRSFGDATVAGGQSQLADIANKARQAAGTVKLGQQFDPTKYTTDADQIFSDFVSSIGDQIRAKVPTNLFKTTNLASIGGAAQGAGNTAYNPLAASGVIDDEDPSKKKTSSGTSIF